MLQWNPRFVRMVVALSLALAALGGFAGQIGRNIGW
jgi:hypothetical protein